MDIYLVVATTMMSMDVLSVWICQKWKSQRRTNDYSYELALLACYADFCILVRVRLEEEMNRCMCGKPEGIYDIVYEQDLDNIIGYPEAITADLHFKVATTECERCGRGLCSDCRSRPMLPFIWICPTCAEVRR